MTVAAIYLCLLAMLYRLRSQNQRWRNYSTFLISENLWRAQRYGTDGSLVDFGKGRLVPYADLIEEFIEMLADDAVVLEVTEELHHARVIVDGGTSAHRQLAAYEAALAGGASEREALLVVVDHLIEDTLFGI